MRLFSRNNINGLLYLTPIQLENEWLPEAKTRVLCCDAKGQVGSRVIDTSEYELTKAQLQESALARKSCAIIAMETTSGNSVPVSVELNIEQTYALNRIYECVIERGYIPDILKRYSREIIQQGEVKYRLLVRSSESTVHYASSNEESEVLKWLPDYPDDELDVAIPMYKAQCKYPVIVLKRLSSNERSKSNIKRFLVLDNDGDLATIRIPLDIFGKVERHFKEWKRITSSEGCLICSAYSGSLMIKRIEITKSQKRALNEIIRYYRETGYGRQPISYEAMTVLAEARIYSIVDKT